MGYHDIMRVCLKGHEITDSNNRNHEFRKDCSDICGEKTIISCPKCNAPIRGRYHREGVFYKCTDKPSIRANLSDVPDKYAVFLDELKNSIRTARIHVALSANMELVLLYWDIGKCILEKQTHEGWGAKVIERLSYDLHREFPDIHGFSRRNLLFMRAFAEAYPESEIVKQLVSQIP